jgi:hypothetical protein
MRFDSNALVIYKQKPNKKQIKVDKIDLPNNIFTVQASMIEKCIEG